MRAAFSALQLIYKDRNKKYLLHILKLVTFMNIKTFLFWFQIKFYINLKPNINIQHCVEVFGLFYLLKRRRLSCLCFYAPSFSLGCGLTTLDDTWQHWTMLDNAWWCLMKLDNAWQQASSMWSTSIIHGINKHHICYSIIDNIVSLIATFKHYALV